MKKLLTSIGAIALISTTLVTTVGSDYNENTNFVMQTKANINQKKQIEFETPYFLSDIWTSYYAHGTGMYWKVQPINVKLEKNTNITLQVNGNVNYSNMASEEHHKNIGGYSVNTYVKESTYDPFSKWDSQEFENMSDVVYEHTLEQGLARYTGAVRIGVFIYKNNMFAVVGVHGYGNGLGNDTANVSVGGISSMEIII